MNILEVNTVNFGSTGTIMRQIADAARKDGNKVWLSYPKYNVNEKNRAKGDILIGNKLAFYIHSKITSYTGFNGCGSVVSTIRFLKKVDQLDIDCVHLHNLHSSYINLPILFHYLKKKEIPVVWTLHDCWSFTGQCAYFTIAKCDRWRSGCHHCTQIKIYPSSHVDQTRIMWKLKRRWFCGVEDMTIVTPSKWLSKLVKQSYLAEYPVKIIYNGVDLDVFQPRASSFREKYGITNEKHILLGVAMGWGKRKGLDVFIELTRKLPENYQFVLVGTDDKTDACLPNNVISIHRTLDQRELAEIYSAADVFINPTREEVLGMVNIEALACGTPVITFDTDGSPECIDESCGIVVPCDDISALESAIHHVVNNRPFSAECCRKRAEQFSMQSKFAEYVDVYKYIARTRKLEN